MPTRVILLITQDATATLAITEALRERGHIVLIARPWQAAVEAIGRLRPDVVLCHVPPGLPVDRIAADAASTAGTRRYALIDPSVSGASPLPTWPTLPFDSLPTILAALDAPSSHLSAIRPSNPS